ncbi:MAG: Wzz/FepE/Etk N-terminal domain-containing protein [Pseudomonadota bacterium]|nr:Wzz/FepE/Etk N-terminal domain-containing protein [Pseudomonadota bacterium]
MTTNVYPSENYLHEFLRIFFANRRLIAKVFLAFALVTLLVAFFGPKNYDVTAEVIVLSKKLTQADASTGVLSQESTKFIPPSLADMETESNVLRSSSLLREVARSLHERGEFPLVEGWLSRFVTGPARQAIMPPLNAWILDPVRDALGLEREPKADNTVEKLALEAADALTVETLPGSNVISLVYRDPDPERARVFVHALLERYLARRAELQSSELPVAFYNEKRNQYRQRLSELEDSRLALLRGVTATEPSVEIASTLEMARQEQRLLNELNDRRLEQASWLAYLREHLAKARRTGSQQAFSFPYSFTDTASGVAYEDREIRQLGENLAQLSIRYGNEAATFRDDSKRMQQLQEQIDRARGQFIAVVENRIGERARAAAVVDRLIAQKEERIRSMRERIDTLQAVLPAVRQLDTEIDSLHGAFTAYTQRFEERRSGQAFDEQEMSNTRVLSWPVVPDSPAFPKPLHVLLIGLLSGALLSIATGYLREFFDHSFKHPHQVREKLGLPVLMTIDEQVVKEVVKARPPVILPR